MAKRIKQRVQIGDETKWVTGYSQQDVILNAAKALMDAGMLDSHPTPQEESSTVFKDYADYWYETFKKPGVRHGTASCYENILRSHIYPHIGEMPLAAITTADLQNMFIKEAERGLAYSSLKIWKCWILQPISMR